MKLVIKPFQRLLMLIGLAISLLALLVGCQMPFAVQSASVDTKTTQKRLTANHSDAKVVLMLQHIISQQETLLIEEQQDENGWPLPDIGVVVLYETELCQLEKEIRSARLNRYKNAKDLMSRFETLLLASCAPDFTPSVLARSVKQVRQSREWPQSYLAYFDMLERHQQALLRLEKLYGNLKQHMDTTIEKLTEIEVETQP